MGVGVGGGKLGVRGGGWGGVREVVGGLCGVV